MKFGELEFHTEVDYETMKALDKNTLDVYTALSSKKFGNGVLVRNDFKFASVYDAQMQYYDEVKAIFKRLGYGTVLNYDSYSNDDFNLMARVVAHEFNDYLGVWVPNGLHRVVDY